MWFRSQHLAVAILLLGVAAQKSAFQEPGEDLLENKEDDRFSFHYHARDYGPSAASPDKTATNRFGYGDTRFGMNAKTSYTRSERGKRGSQAHTTEHHHLMDLNKAVARDGFVHTPHLDSNHNNNKPYFPGDAHPLPLPDCQSLQQDLEGSNRFIRFMHDQRSDIKDALGNTIGSYTYIDKHGTQRSIYYVLGPDIYYRTTYQGPDERHLLICLESEPAFVTESPTSLKNGFEKEQKQYTKAQFTFAPGAGYGAPASGYAIPAFISGVEGFQSARKRLNTGETNSGCSSRSSALCQSVNSDSNNNIHSKDNYDRKVCNSNGENAPC